MRNLGYVHHLAASVKEHLPDMSDYGRLTARLQRDGCREVICPKPQRMPVVISTSEPVRSLRQQHQSLSPAGSECDEILEILMSKTMGNPSNFGSSPPYFCGSPPSRIGNPLVHDVHFIHQSLPPSPVIPTQPKSLRATSLQGSPSVRVEGFDCSGQDSRRGVRAFA